MTQRPLIGGSIEIRDPAEWRQQIKKLGLISRGNMRSTHVFAEALNTAGQVVGVICGGEHGVPGGFISPDRVTFLIDWVDEVTRIQEQAIACVEAWKASTSEQKGLGNMHAEIVQRHVDGLPGDLARLEESKALRQAMKA
jgi:hypothetical protein